MVLANHTSLAEIPHLQFVNHSDERLTFNVAWLIFTELAGEPQPRQDDLEELIEGLRSRITVAAVNDSDMVLAVGSLRLEEEGNFGVIENVVTAASERKRGWGRLVIGTLESTARSEGLNRVILYPLLTAERFYYRLGYSSGTEYFFKNL